MRRRTMQLAGTMSLTVWFVWRDSRLFGLAVKPTSSTNFFNQLLQPRILGEFVDKLLDLLRLRFVRERMASMYEYTTG